MLPPLPAPWAKVLRTATEAPAYRQLAAFLEQEAASGQTVLPAGAEVFRALALTPPDTVKVVLLGQDPYPTPGHAHGLSFSVRPGVKPLPASLRNIFRELQADVGFRPPGHGSLESWARQGVLLLNTLLTVRAGTAGSHQGRGWEPFTGAVIDAVNARASRVVFLLWGNRAQAHRDRITAPQHAVLEAAHPSPLARGRFFGCRCFSAANRCLAEAGLAPVDWQIPDLAGPGPQQGALGL